MSLLWMGAISSLAQQQYQSFHGQEAVYELYQSRESTPAPFLVFFSSRKCTYCTPMLKAFKKAANQAMAEKLNIVFADLECYDILDSCKKNLAVENFPDVRYWDIHENKPLKDTVHMTNKRHGRHYRQRRDAISFLHFARRLAHSLAPDAVRPPTAYPFVSDASQIDFDTRMPFEPEPSYMLKQVHEAPESDHKKDLEAWFRDVAVQKHDRNAFFVVPPGQKVNTTKWPHIDRLPDGLHMISVWSEGLRTYEDVTDWEKLWLET